MTNRVLGMWVPGLFLCGLLVASIGCEKTARSLALDQDRAREACSEFLTAWKEGKSSNELEPEIMGGDHEWEAGKKLVSFEFLPDETNDGTNLHIPVRLVLRGTSGSESKVDAMYTVGTSPVVTVVREEPMEE